MTDRLNAITVVLDHDIRDDDAEPLLNAIRMLRGVLEVTPHVADYASHVAESRARQAWRERILKILREDKE